MCGLCRTSDWSHLVTKPNGFPSRAFVDWMPVTPLAEYRLHSASNSYTDTAITQALQAPLPLLHKMSSDLISCLRLGEEYEQGRVIVSKEINGCDSSFITSCIIAHCVKNKYPLLLVTIHNPLSHYQNVGLKMNYNLQKHISDGLIECFSVGENYVEGLLLGEENSVKTITEELQKRILVLKNKFDKVNVIADGVSHLFDLQYSLREINNFCNSLIKIVTGNRNSFIFFQCNVAYEDDVTHVMANLLSHQAYIVINVENLPSGWSLDVSGQITITYPGLKFEDEHMFMLDLKPTQFLFKLFEKGVKLFAPGTV